SKEISELIGDGALTISSLPLLGMGRDAADGRLLLKDGRLAAEWTAETSEELFSRVRRTMRGIADVLGADYADNPMWFRKRIITVHPLGGAPMGLHRGEGVCDAFGEVFGYPGLYIADGAAMPGPVGPNPSLTIAAHADRLSTRLLEKASAGRSAGGSTATVANTPTTETTPTARPSTGAEPAERAGSSEGSGNGPAYGPGSGRREGSRGPADAAGGRTSLSFTEEMKGHVTFGETDPRAGELSDGRVPLSFHLTITADDVDRFLAEPDHEARAEGWVDSPGHGGRRPVERGTFNLFVEDGPDDRRLMKYRLFYTDGEGRPRTLSGVKNVLHGPPTRIWPDTSTLYVRLFDGHVGEDGEAGATVVAAGVLHIKLADFAKQLTTFRTSGPDGVDKLLDFGRFFAGGLWEVYGPDLV
ncbi:MAG TPA: GMC oxidoreductase, partial [Spirillospora sp.]